VGLESDIAFCAQESIVGAVPRLAETVDGIAVIERRRPGERARPRSMNRPRPIAKT
jgi:hypothetical protein